MQARQITEDIKLTSWKNVREAKPKYSICKVRNTGWSARIYEVKTKKRLPQKLYNIEVDNGYGRHKKVRHEVQGEFNAKAVAECLLWEQYEKHGKGF